MTGDVIRLPGSEGSSFLNVAPGDQRLLPAVEAAAVVRRDCWNEYVDALWAEHETVWKAVDAGVSWADVAWLLGDPLAHVWSRHHQRGVPGIFPTPPELPAEKDEA